MLKITKNYNKKAFSIGEVMLSVFILGVTMITILSMYSGSLRNLHDDRDSIIASMLAQEGVELIRNVRDNNWSRRDSAMDTTPAAFDNMGVSSGTIQSDCRIDSNSYAINGNNEVVYSSVDCSGASRALNINASGFYVHDAGTATKFRRTIALDYRSGNEMIVTSFVSWDGSNPTTDKSLCLVEDKCVFSESTLGEWGTGM